VEEIPRRRPEEGPELQIVPSEQPEIKRAPEMPPDIGNIDDFLKEQERIDKKKRGNSEPEA